MLLSYCSKFYIATTLTVIAIILLSLLPVPVPEVAKDVPLFDKWAHFVMYGFLALVVWTEMNLNDRRKDAPHSSSKTKKAALWLLIFGCLLPALLGGLLELAQAYLTTTRSGELLDFYADSIGAVLGSALGYGLRRRLL